MRLYTFINCYLSSIQQGIQTAHILGELVNCFAGSHPEHLEIIDEYLEKHKTIIVCNGGNNASIRELCNFFTGRRNPYPWATFREDKDSLDGALTGVGIILPEEIYNATSRMEGGLNLGWGELPKRKCWVQHLRDGREVFLRDPDDFTYQLIERVKSASLAR